MMRAAWAGGGGGVAGDHHCFTFGWRWLFNSCLLNSAAIRAFRPLVLQSGLYILPPWQPPLLQQPAAASTAT